MNKYQEIAIRALENSKGDDLERARRAYNGFTQEQMAVPYYGQSGKTRAQILVEYEAQRLEIIQAIAWVRNAL